MIRVAIVGLGEAARNIHLPAYHKLGDKVSVVAGCDIDNNARAFAKDKWRLPEVFDNSERMIESVRPDIVSICTPPSLHYEGSMMAFEHGCHVFCEKPVAESLSQTDEIIKASRKSDRFLVVNSEFPYMNIHTSTKKLIGSPEFGRLLFLHAWQTFNPTKHTEASWRGDMQRRISLDFGVHVFELIRFFFEENPTRLFCHMPAPSPDISHEVANIISLEFADGRAACIVLDRLSKGPDSYLEMRLDGEFASIHTAIGGEVRFEIGIHTRERRPYFSFNFVRGGKAILLRGNESKIVAKDGINPFAAATAVHFGNFLEALENGREPEMTVKYNRNTLALALAAHDSAHSGLVVEMKNYLDDEIVGNSEKKYGSPYRA